MVPTVLAVSGCRRTSYHTSAPPVKALGQCTRNGIIDAVRLLRKVYHVPGVVSTVSDRSSKKSACSSPCGGFPTPGRATKKALCQGFFCGSDRSLRQKTVQPLPRAAACRFSCRPPFLRPFAPRPPPKRTPSSAFPRKQRTTAASFRRHASARPTNRTPPVSPFQTPVSRIWQDHRFPAR